MRVFGLQFAQGVAHKTCALRLGFEVLKSVVRVWA